jgi:hypothetical protein
MLEEIQEKCLMREIERYGKNVRRFESEYEEIENDIIDCQITKIHIIENKVLHDKWIKQIQKSQKTDENVIDHQMNANDRKKPIELMNFVQNVNQKKEVMIKIPIKNEIKCQRKNNSIKKKKRKRRIDLTKDELRRKEAIKYIINKKKKKIEDRKYADQKYSEYKSKFTEEEWKTKEEQTNLFLQRTKEDSSINWWDAPQEIREHIKMGSWYGKKEKLIEEERIKIHEKPNYENDNALSEIYKNYIDLPEKELIKLSEQEFESRVKFEEFLRKQEEAFEIKIYKYKAVEDEEKRIKYLGDERKLEKLRREEMTTFVPIPEINKRIKRESRMLEKERWNMKEHHYDYDTNEETWEFDDRTFHEEWEGLIPIEDALAEKEYYYEYFPNDEGFYYFWTLDTLKGLLGKNLHEEEIDLNILDRKINTLKKSNECSRKVLEDLLYKHKHRCELIELWKSRWEVLWKLNLDKKGINKWEIERKNIQKDLKKMKLEDETEYLFFWDQLPAKRNPKEIF